MPTNISWTDESWNPVHGCSKVSAGCANCYAERISRRYNHTEHPWTAEHASANVQQKPGKLDEPLGWDDGRRVFVNSMSDLFHEAVDESFVRDVFRTMRQTPRHVYQILTKRPERAAALDIHWPEHVWLGVSVEDDRVVDRIDTLRSIPAATRFISFEPLLGPVEPNLEGIDWAIVGGESGPDYRPMDHEWAWPILEAAREADTAFFFKQSAGRQSETGTRLLCPDDYAREIREVPPVPEITQEARAAREEVHA
jgi:protein gp37